MWLKQLLQKLRLYKLEDIGLICNNQTPLHIASNPIFLVRTKHIKLNCYFIQEKIILNEINIVFVNSHDQLLNIFTKSLQGPKVNYICNKLNAHNIYTPT